MRKGTQKDSADGSGYLLCQVRAEGGRIRHNPTEVRVVDPEDGGELRRLPIDGCGRFLLRRASLDHKGGAVELQVLDARGKAPGSGDGHRSRAGCSDTDHLDLRGDEAKEATITPPSPL